MGVNDSFSTRRQRLLDDAVAAVGHDDFGDPGFLTNFERHLGSIFEEGRVDTEAGWAMTEAQIGLALRTLLHAQAGFKARPDALARPIERPLIIAGIPRSGTTALHRLLSIDPQFQGTEHWITRAPMARPARADWTSFPAYHEAKAGLDATVEAAPELLNDHMHEVDAVEESLFLLAATFCSNHWPSQWYVPSYDAWYRQADERPSYRWLADVHRLVGADTYDRRWLIKNPTDIFSIDAVLDAFPDAMIIQTHRDPVQAVPSLANLLVAVRSMYEGANCDRTSLLRREVDFWQQATARAEVAKRREPQRYLDVEFGDFVRDQMATVARIYDHFEMVLDAGVEREMREWLAANPRRAGAVQRHKPEDFGVPTAEVAEVYAEYRQAHGYV